MTYHQIADWVSSMLNEIPEMGSTPTPRFFSSVQDFEAVRNDLEPNLLYAVLDYEDSGLVIDADTVVSRDAYTLFIFVKGSESKSIALQNSLTVAKKFIVKMRQSVYSNASYRNIDESSLSIEGNQTSNFQFIGAMLYFVYEHNLNQI